MFSFANLIPQTGWCHRPLLPPLCLPWETSDVHLIMIVATVVLPFGNHSNPWAIMAMIWHFCPVYVSPHSIYKWRGLSRLTHRSMGQSCNKETMFLGLDDHCVPQSLFYGRRKVVRLSQPCVKRVLMVGMPRCWVATIQVQRGDTQYWISHVWKLRRVDCFQIISMTGPNSKSGAGWK